MLARSRRSLIFNVQAVIFGYRDKHLKWDFLNSLQIWYEAVKQQNQMIVLTDSKASVVCCFLYIYIYKYPTRN